LGAVFIVLVSGVLVAGKGSLTRCLGWPMWRLMGNDLPGWPQAARLLMAGVASALIVAVVIHTWSRRRTRVALPRAAMAVGVLFLAEMVAGVVMLAGGFTIPLLAIYVAAAAALWGLLVVLTVLTGIGPG
jgi:cytochrome c oxidase assembly protein subunit 15